MSSVLIEQMDTYSNNSSKKVATTEQMNTEVRLRIELVSQKKL